MISLKCFIIFFLKKTKQNKIYI